MLDACHGLGRHGVADLGCALVLGAQAALARRGGDLGVAAFASGESGARIGRVNDLLCSLVTRSVRQVLIRLCLRRYLLARRHCSLMKHLCLGELRIVLCLSLLELLQVLTGVNFRASGLIVVKVLGVGDLVAPCASSQLWLDLPGDLAGFVLRDSALHKVCCHC